MQNDKKTQSSTSPSSSSSSHSQSTSQGESRSSKKENQFQIDLSKYRQYTEEIKNKNLNTIEMLSASVSNHVQPEDSVSYNPKNIHLLPTKYPIYPLNFREEIAKQFNDDTLFFIFFMQQDMVSKEIALRQLQKRGWMLHTQYNTFVQLQGIPKNKTNEYIEGKFKFFDFEQNWIIRTKQEFKFESKYLEKEKA